MSNYFYNYVKFILVISIFIIMAFMPSIISGNQNFSDASTNSNLVSDSIVGSNYGWIWPIQNYKQISSYYGRRASPTLHASSFHLGIDIPAPEGTPLIACDDGKVIFASWGAGGGYTITLQLSNYDNIKVSYCHVSPIMYIKYGDLVEKGKIIGCVGPKNVYGIKNNPYVDSNGNPTNGATTGCHLHFAVKENNKNVNPLNYYDLN